MPPAPPPRVKPLMDMSMYKNMPPGIFENSSDSELERMEAKLFSTTQRNKIAFRKPRNPMSTLDRLSVRTEVTPAQSVLPTNPGRKLLTLSTEESTPTNERLLYFAPNDADDCSVKEKTSESDDGSQETPTKTMPDTKNTPSTILHDTILATQLRHINRELTPTISEVYHERSIGLGLAPSLSKLLLNQANAAAPQTDNSVLEKITLGILEETDLNAEAAKSPQCCRCQLELTVCSCKNVKTTKPWLSESAGTLQQIQSSDLTTADILEREVKNKNKVFRSVAQRRVCIFAG